MRVVCLSDTHGWHRSLTIPQGDLLLHAGDLTTHGDLAELADVGAWLRSLPHPRKVVIAGNHDFCCEESPEAAREALQGLDYLLDESVEIGGLLIYGSPWQPEFCRLAFNLPRGPRLRERWARIPEQVAIVVTHGPPYGILDRTTTGQRAGCADLARRLEELHPRLHLFGHIHEGYGCERREETLYCNAAICNLRNRPVRQPMVFDLD